MTPSHCFLLSVLLAVSLTCFVSANAGLYGGLEDVDTNSEDERLQLQKAVDFAEVELNKMSNSLYYMMVTDIVKAKKQLVKGLNYYLTLEMASTDCKKNTKLLALDSCKPSDKENAHSTQLCDVVVYTVPWENTTSLTKSSCHPAKDDKQKTKL